MSDEQTLSIAERTILCNQYRILQSIHKNDKDACDHFKSLYEIVSNGYVCLYRQVFDHMSDEVPEDVTDEVYEILNMHQAMYHAAEDAQDSDLQKDVKFYGFDANNELTYLHFAQHLTRDPNYYRVLQPVVNSHIPTLPRYRKMLSKWRSLNESKLSTSEVRAILEAGTFNSAAI